MSQGSPDTPGDVVTQQWFDLESHLLPAGSPLTQKEAERAVVYIENETDWLGTGFVISPDGLVVTAYHVVKEEPTYWVRFVSPNSGPIDARLVGWYCDDPRPGIGTDLAILQLTAPGEYPWLPLTSPHYQPQVNQPATFLGVQFHPQWQKFVTRDGRITDVRQTGAMTEIEVKIQLMFGCSGGALVDSSYSVFGMIKFDLGPGFATFAVSTRELYRRFGRKEFGDGPASSTACPICAWVSQEAICPRCSWVLEGPLTLGAPTEVELRTFTDLLRVAQRRWDLRAAVRAAGPPGARNHSVLDHLVSVSVRGATVRGEVESTDGEINWLDQASVEASVETLATIINRHVADARPGASIVVIDLTLDGVTTIQLHIDLAGTPRPEATPMIRLWINLIPGLSHDARQASFQLAGGVGTTPLNWKAIDASLRQFAASLHLDKSGVSTVVLTRLPGWLIPERMVDYLRSYQ